MPTLDDIAKFINSVGLPTALVTVALFAVWYFARIFATHAPSIVAAHNALTESLKDTTEKQADTQCRQTELLEEMHGTITMSSDGLYHAANAIEELADTEEQKRRVAVHTAEMRRRLGARDRK